MLTFSVYDFLYAKTVSVFAPGGSYAKSGGPVRSATSSLSPFGSGRVINLRTGALIFPPAPAALAEGLPPLMLIPTALFPAPLPVFAGAPGCFPSGEIETRAARLPGGGCTGAGGAGFAESAMRAFGAPLAAVNCVAPTSGAETAL